MCNKFELYSCLGNFGSIFVWRLSYVYLVYLRYKVDCYSLPYLGYIEDTFLQTCE